MRGIGLVLTLMVLSLALTAGHLAYMREQFFDPALYQNTYPCSLDPRYGPDRFDPFTETLLSEPLRAAGERPLYKSDLGGQTTVRFSFLPVFERSLVVRIDDLYGATPQLVATRNVGQVELRPDQNHIKRNLLEAEVEEIRNLVGKIEAKNIQPDSCLTIGVDGAFYLIEIKGPDGYRLINRWVFPESEIYDLSKSLYRLTGWPNGRQGPDRGDLSDKRPPWD